jgi:fucose 4-O-acetylase-like acetyltransferase
MQNDARDETFDMLKGVAIVLVILGHCRVGPLYSFIYSFHMPLFFFISGYFLKIRPLKEELYLSTQRLIVPYIFASCCICAIAFFVVLCDNTGWNFFQLRVVRNLLGFRGGVTPKWIDGHVGLLWFLLAMFWARSIVVFLINKISQGDRRIVFDYRFVGNFYRCKYFCSLLHFARPLCG